MAKSNKELKELKTFAHAMRELMITPDPTKTEVELIHRDIATFMVYRLGIANDHHEVNIAESFNAVGHALGSLTSRIANINEELAKHLLGAVSVGYLTECGIDLDIPSTEPTAEVEND